MAKLALSFALLFNLAAFMVADHHEGVELVDTTVGQLEGVILKTHEDKTVEGFLGVPYAKPPIGDLRFKAPVAVEKASAVLKVQKKPPSCRQSSLTFGRKGESLGHYMVSLSEESEDCLYLNVYVPHPRPTNASVMVFIHGGGFVVGSSNVEKYDGRELAAEEGVIVVTVNYRLSVFGLLYMGCDEAPGNQALLDMKLALNFVKENIAHFGGNPKSVTLVGEGSGANAAGLLMLSHSCDCLFQKLVLLNGSPMNVFTVHSKKEASATSDRLASKLGCSFPKHEDHAKILECLRSKDAQALIDISEEMLHTLGFFYPVVDGNLLVSHPRVLAKQGAFEPSIPVMLGVSRHRGFPIVHFLTSLKPSDDSYLSQYDVRNLIKKLLRTKSDFETSSILYHYTNFTHPNDPEAIRHEAIDLATDSMFICPMNKFADELALSGNDVYMFYIRHHSSKSKHPEFVGNVDGEDIDYLFGHATPENGYTQLEHDRSHHLMDHLSHFMQTGDPNLSKEDRHFPSYTLRTKSYLDVRVGGTQGHFLQADKCAFFDHAFSRVKYAAALMASHNC